jgi:integrase
LPCLRRTELISLKTAHLQQQGDHWDIIEPLGKGGYVRTVPMPDWVRVAVDDWLDAPRIGEGHTFRCVTNFPADSHPRMEMGG